MYFIVNVPENSQQELQKAVNRINPDAEPITAVAKDEEGRTTSIALAGGFYETQVRDEQPNLPPWNAMDESARLAFAADLAGYIGWQFEGFTFDYHLPEEIEQTLLQRTAA